jgi:preprotein translocase subunit SecE
MNKLKQWWEATVLFFAETRAEMRKVTFPSRDEVVATTVVVIITSFLFAFFLWLADMAIIKTYEATLKVFGS